jgi:tetratricopeptide (TPR) repeat protein
MVVTMFGNSQFFEPSGRPEIEQDEVERIARQAAIHAGKGEIAAAMRLYQLALLSDESRAEVWYEYGMLQYRAGQLNDSLESLEFALRQDPALYPARYRMARVCYETGRPLEALQQFRHVTKQRPNYFPAWRYVVQITWALGDLVEAEAAAKEALSHAKDPEIQAMLQRVVQERKTLDCGSSPQ